MWNNDIFLNANPWLNAERCDKSSERKKKQLRYIPLSRWNRPIGTIFFVEKLEGKQTKFFLKKIRKNWFFEFWLFDSQNAATNSKSLFYPTKTKFSQLKIF